MKMPKIPKIIMFLLAIFTLLVIGMFFKNTTSLREGMEDREESEELKSKKAQMEALKKEIEEEEKRIKTEVDISADKIQEKLREAKK